MGCRNHRGDMLANFLNKEKLYCLNTFYNKKKQRKWTWQSPDGKTKNEIDFVLSNFKNIVKDVTVLNSLNTGSDHRMVRARIEINTKLNRSKLLSHNKISNLNVLEQNQEEYQKQLTEKLKPISILKTKDINTLAHILTKNVTSISKKICAQNKNPRKTKLKQATLDLMEERRKMSKEAIVEYNAVNKKIKKSIRSDLRAFKTKQILETIEGNKSMRVLKSNLAKGKQQITKIKNQQGQLVNEKSQIIQEIQTFYKNLYTSTIQNPKIDHRTILNVGSETLPEISSSEIKNALRQMKNKKSPGEDGISAEMLKMGGNTVLDVLKILLNKCLTEKQIPDLWKNAEVILLHKKGDTNNIENYRPISLLSHLYKLLTRIITNRVTQKLDLYQPVEQAGFRKGFGTTDHLQSIRTLIEKTTEYNVPLHMAFVDFHKAFDSIETWSFLSALKDARIDSRYTTLIKNIYEHATFHIKVNEDAKTEQIRLGKGIRQGDTISPKLFTLALENVFKLLDWDGKGLNIDGIHLSHLRFADDIVLFSTDIKELEQMLKELNEQSNKIGLEINLQKTKIMSQFQPKVIIDNVPIENVDHYIYLGHVIKIGKENQIAEIKRRIQLSWAAFGKLGYILRNKEVPMCLKRRVYDQCILPVTTYGLETMAFTKKSLEQLSTTQRAMERSMLGISLRDKIRNVDIRNKTRIVDVLERIARLKWQWAGHVARDTFEKWTQRIINWRPRETKRGIGRPQKRWIDDIKLVAGKQWFRLARDRHEWKSLEEAYVQQWINTG